ncbi:hypothetical protein QJQ45_029203 [Haematococcus lacustris]|nr:hypothetical protein QJQ45_029203 [Haematococcus lacustris]
MSGQGQPGEPRTEWTDAALLHTPLAQLMSAAAALRDQAHPHITFSPKVFLPLTRLCRDTCGYCAFTQDPVPGRRSFMTLEEVIKVAREGAAQGCCEALLTLGDRPEARWAEVGEELRAMGYASTLDYVEAAAAAVLHHTGLLPHINAGLMSESWLARLKAVSASQGLMLESGAPELLLPGGGAPRLPGQGAGGQAGGLLVGLGESRAQRLADLRFLADCQQRWGHLQEVIIQNFRRAQRMALGRGADLLWPLPPPPRAKQGTAMAAWPEPSLEELLWTVAAARLVLGPLISLQAPPNLTPEADDSQQGGAGARAAGWTALLRAGINDWGGISPLTRDWVNPEAPWPHLEALAQATAAAGFLLLPRLPVYPAYQGWRGAQPLSHTPPLSPGPEGGRPRPDCQTPPPCPPPPALASAASHAPEAPAAPLSAWLSAEGGPGSVAAQVRRLADGSGLVRAALPLAAMACPPPRWHVAMGEDGGLLGFPQAPGVSRRIALLLERVMLHARQVMSEEQQQQAAGGAGGGGPGGEGPWQALALPPGWVNPLGQADVAALLAARGPDCRAVLRAADQLRQMDRTGGITEFVPLPFVHMAAPVYLKGGARRGPTLHECLLLHAVARLALYPGIKNIQASWVKMGPERAGQLLSAGCNDMGGSLMNESITRAAGAGHGQELPPRAMQQLILGAGRRPRQRTTLYGSPSGSQTQASLSDNSLQPLSPLVTTGPALPRAPAP